MANHAIVRTDKMMGTDVRSMLVSIKYIVDDAPTEIENGNVLKVGALMDGEREIFAGSAPKATDTIDDIVLVASPELAYGETSYALGKFTNKAGAPCRGYHLHSGDIFSVTKEALVGEDKPAVGNTVELTAGTKLNVAKSATSGSTAIGKVIAVDIVSGHTFYVIEVA